jgi:hypothetical protein
VNPAFEEPEPEEAVDQEVEPFAPGKKSAWVRVVPQVRTLS